MDAAAPIGILRPVPIVLGPQHVLQPPPVRACPGCGRGNVGWHGFNLSTLCADCLSVLRPEQVPCPQPQAASPFPVGRRDTASDAASAPPEAQHGPRPPREPADPPRVSADPHQHTPSCSTAPVAPPHASCIVPPPARSGAATPAAAADVSSQIAAQQFGVARAGLQPFSELPASAPSSDTAWHAPSSSCSSSCGKAFGADAAGALADTAATADTAALLVAAAAAATGARVPASPAADEPVARSDNPTSPRQPVAPWTEQEDAAIRAGVLQHGSKWRNFPLPGRSTDAVRNRWGRLKERDTADAGLGGEGAAGWDHASQEAPSRGMATASDVPAPASDADPVEVRSTVSRAKKGAPILKATAPAAAHGRNLRKRLR
mmetsp:Transcript_4101/g.13759  ORF Transcript_4101/g.13759 Transcript_4101/m.13759 type:complete len:376 (-) Transcript_4101:144-1271(-)